MTLLQALILGLVQGLTEFFPISSSAHLRLAKWLLGMDSTDSSVYFDLICHSGTLFALLIYLRHEVRQVLGDPKKIALFFVALLPLVPAYFLLKPLRIAASQPHFLGASLLFTSFLLFAACRRKKEEEKSKSQKWGDVICIGVMQSLALIPGVSRSGSTIAMARFRNWEWIDAARFSFLLSIPAILGGQFLETYKLLGEPAPFSISCCAVGFLASFGAGWCAVRLAFALYEKGRLRPFAWYCLGLALLAWAIFYA